MDEEPEKKEEKKYDIKKYFKKITKKDWLAILALIIFVILVSIPVYIPKGECEVARPGYKCESLKNVMIENCNYWSNYSCDSNADVSLPQIEWYIGNLCKLQNQYHKSNLDCANLKLACNQITESQTCPIGV